MNLTRIRRLAAKLADETRRAYSIWRLGDKWFIHPIPRPEPGATLIETVYPAKPQTEGGAA